MSAPVSPPRRRWWVKTAVAAVGSAAVVALALCTIVAWVARAPSSPARALGAAEAAVPLEASDGVPSNQDGPGTLGALFSLALQLLALSFLGLIQFICYKRSTGQPADIEEGLVASAQTVQEDLWGAQLMLTQIVKLVELCGWEAKNRYISGDGGFFIDERSDCPQRICASTNREVTLFGHAGPGEESPVVLRMYKPYHIQGCCFCRPEMHVNLPDGTEVGHIKDPFRCCELQQQLFARDEELRYEVTGSVCQAGAFCQCCADFHFDVLDRSGNEVGTITKPALTFGECCRQSNRFVIDFPEQCSMDDKRLLVGSAMLLDLQYFEVNKNKN